MRGIYICIFMTCSLLLVGCNSAKEGTDIPLQNYATGLSQVDGPTGSLHGTIRFPSEYNQRTVSFVVNGRRFITQPDGRFNLKNIPVGQHSLQVLVKGYEPIESTFQIQEDTMTTLPATRLTTARGKLYGRLVSEAGGSASNISVKLSPQGGVAKTDNDGIFEFIGVQTGAYSLSVVDNKFFTYDRTISINSGENHNLGVIPVHPRVQMPVQRTARMPNQ